MTMSAKNRGLLKLCVSAIVQYSPDCASNQKRPAVNLEVEASPPRDCRSAYPLTSVIPLHVLAVSEH
jgi:hypothetical protein